jgi:hypothetical protein
MRRYIISTPRSRQDGAAPFGIYASDEDEAFATVERHFGHPVDGLKLERIEGGRGHV